MLRDNAGRVTNRFATPADATLAIAGGDFKYHTEKKSVRDYEMEFGYYTYQPASLKVEYAPMGSDSFSELAITEDESRFLMPYGAYWTVAIDKVDAKSANGWFDLRITVTDESGNYQRQVISPAFNIESCAGIGNTVTNRNIFSVRNGSIVSSTGEDVTVYTTDGRKVENWKNRSRMGQCARGIHYISLEQFHSQGIHIPLFIQLGVWDGYRIKKVFNTGQCIRWI